MAMYPETEDVLDGEGRVVASYPKPQEVPNEPDGD
jgi:hypothetical protein